MLLACNGRAHTLWQLSKVADMYVHTQPQGVRSFSSREGDGNVMQMSFCGENFRRQRRERRWGRRERREDTPRGWSGANQSPPPSPPQPRDRPRARIIFTEIKSKIRLALKCALDRARPNRRWLSERSSYPEARKKIVRSSRENPTRMRRCTGVGKRRKIDRGRQRKLQGFKPKEFLAHANQRFAGVGEERRDCTS